MYTFLVTQDNKLITSAKERIMHRSKLVDKMHFLVDPIYNDLEMKDFTVILKYKLPISNELCTEELVLSKDLYKDKLEYVLPIDTKLTKEYGDIELFLTFLNEEMDENGTVIQRIRQIDSTFMTIHALPEWSNATNDSYLSVVDQKLLQVQGMIRELEEEREIIITTKADNIVLDEETHEMYLTADGKAIGNKISMEDIGDSVVVNAPEGLVTMLI